MFDALLDALRAEGDLLESPHHLLGPFHGSGVRQLHVNHEVAHVLRRDEAPWSAVESPVGRGEQTGVDKKRYGTDAEHAAHQAHVARCRLAEGRVE